VVEVEIPPPPAEELRPEPLDLAVRYEDDQVLVIDKPAGMVVHPGAGHAAGTLAAAVLAYAPDVAGVGGPRRPGVVHRLDKDTSGLLVMARTQRAYESLTAQLAARTVSRRYLAVSQGRLAQAQGIVEMTYDVNLINGRPLQLLGGVRYGDRYTMREGDQTWRVFEYKVFRYLLIVFRNVDQPISVDSISVVAYNYPAKRRGSFECSDPVLTKLWKASVDTTYLHMEDTLVCDAVRERLSWIGDGAHGLYGMYAGFGDIAITDWFFRLLKRGALADGMLRIYYPGSEPPVGGQPRSPARSSTAYENPQNIPQFALFYGMFVAEHYQYFGKKKLLEELYPALVGVAEWYERHSDDTGLIYSLSNLTWVDWVPTEMNGANFETNALYYNLLDDMSRLAVELNKPQEAEKWKLQATKIKNSSLASATILATPPSAACESTIPKITRAKSGPVNSSIPAASPSKTSSPATSTATTAPTLLPSAAPPTTSKSTGTKTSNQ
jgi:hypothetical protein